MSRIKLYDYQQKMLADIIAVFSEKQHGVFYDKKGKRISTGNSVMVQMPTGTGKTVVMAAVVQWFLRNHEGDVWIIAHRRELVEQAQHTVIRFLESFRMSKYSCRVKVLSVQWLARHAKKLATADSIPYEEGELTHDVGLLIVDEAHHAVADSYQDVFEMHRSAFKLGMTATPCRMKKQSFSKLFEYLLVSPPTRSFIDRGYLAPYDYVVIGKYSIEQLTVDRLKTRGADGDYATSEMDEKLNVPDSIKRLYESLCQYAEGRKGIVFAIDIGHAQEIARYYQQQGLRATALDSTTPAKRRSEMVEAFRKGELDCLVNVNLFDEGFDCPDVEYIQMARPTLSLAKYLQMVGRGLRINRENKKKVCMIIDNVGNYRKFGLPDKERNWAGMFSGLRDGKGLLPPSLKPGVQVQGSDMMVTVKRAGNFAKMTKAQQKEYLKNVVPYKEFSTYISRYGLRVSAEDIILEPMHRFISSFVGDYAAYESISGSWGVLGRNGKSVVPPRYSRLQLLPRGKVKIYYQSGLERIVPLKSLMQPV